MGAGRKKVVTKVRLSASGSDARRTRQQPEAGSVAAECGGAPERAHAGNGGHLARY